MSALGAFHTACGALALLVGAAIFLRTKGTRSHIWLGRAYLANMVCLNLSALGIHNLTGGFNIFHALAILNLAIVLVGVAHFFRRRGPQKWLWRHYQYMAWSYVGLLAATVNEALVRVPYLDQFTARTSPWLPLAAMAVLLASSGLVIFSCQKALLGRYHRGD